MVGSSYGLTMSAVGGSPPYTWSDPACSGACNTGLIFNASGVWYGTPVNAGSSTFTIEVTDNLNNSASVSLALIIGNGVGASAPSLSILGIL